MLGPHKAQGLDGGRIALLSRPFWTASNPLDLQGGPALWICIFQRFRDGGRVQHFSSLALHAESLRFNPWCLQLKVFQGQLM